MINEVKRREEIRRLAREWLMMAHDLGWGTKEEVLARAIKKATMIFDDVAAVKIPSTVVAE